MERIHSKKCLNFKFKYNLPNSKVALIIIIIIIIVIIIIIIITIIS